MRGRLEPANLIKQARGPISAIGRLLNYDETVLVTNGIGFVGKECLVRFDLEARLSRASSGLERLFGEDEAFFFDDDEDLDFYPLKTNFISTWIPWGFEERVREGLRPDEYILYARFRRKMFKGRLPSFTDINHYYDPGRIGVFAYIKGDGEGEQIYVINNEEVIVVASYLGVSELLPRPHRRARLVLADSRKGIKKLREEIIEEGLVPVRMEELRHP